MKESVCVPSAMKIDPELRRWATRRQNEFIDAIEKYGCASAANRKLGLAHDVIALSMRRLKKLAATKGYSPDHGMTQSVPEPFSVKGVSTYYDQNGEIRGQWVKTKLDEQKALEAVKEFIEGLAKDVKGLSPPIKPPKKVMSDLLAVYPIGDPHFGMYAWAEEAGEDFDLEIAESLTKGAIDRLIMCSPPSDTAIILSLGDLMHADSSSNRTERSGNALDVDTRWAKVIQVALRSMIYCVQRALTRHKKVIVRLVRGNHDPHSSMAIAIAMSCFFENNKRVQIDLSPSLFWYYRFGKVLIGSTHGDTCKPQDLPGIMATDRPQDWGLTQFRVWYHGHIHHIQHKEYPGCTVEAFQTLAARDAWHSGAGYRAGRSMCSIIHHKDFGEIERHRCDVGMIDG